VTPPAAQRTAFHKNGLPDARAIVDGVVFYIEDDPSVRRLTDISPTPSAFGISPKGGEIYCVI